MVLLVGAVVGPVYDNGYFRYLLVFGSFFIVFGFMMLSLCNDFWQCLLAQGFCVGIGGGALFVPAVAIMPTYFTTKLGLALGLAASGSSMGGIIYPIMFYRLLDEVGFGWAVCIYLHCLPAIGIYALRLRTEDDLLGPNRRIYSARHAHGSIGRYENACKATESALDPRLECFHRWTLHAAGLRHLDRLHWLICRHLLLLLLRSIDRHHQCELSVLPRANPQRRVCVRANAS